MKKIDLTGKKFGKLLVLHETDRINGRTAFLCRCDCGNEKAVLSSCLISGNTKSCGCSAKERGKIIAEKRRGKPSPKLIDLSGKRFGRWIVIGQSHKDKNGQIYWHCRCDCGNEKNVSGSSLRFGQSFSCGCMAREIWAARCRERCTGKPNPKAKDLTGQRFGRLTVIKKHSSEKGRIKWECRCDCGNITYPVTSKLTTGKTVSCGCLGLENATKAKITHGQTHSKLYDVWAAMRNRCYREKGSHWKYYGGKGIAVCEEWKSSFENFYSWALENGYKEGLTIDRIDPDKNYCPENCRWITLAENISRMARKPQEIREKAFKLYNEGVSITEIGKRLNIARVTFTKWKRQEGLPVYSSYPEAMKQLVFCLRHEGMRTKDILEMSGIGESTFHQWLRAAGIS